MLHSAPACLNVSRLAHAAIVVAVATCAPCAWATEGTLEKRAEEFLLQQLDSRHSAEVSVKPSTAKLTPCAEPEFFLPHPDHDRPPLGRTSIGVRCLDQGGHTRYLQANVRVTGEYWVARRPVAAGEVLSEEMLEAQQGDLSQLPRHAILDHRTALGMQVSRPLVQGAPIQGTSLRQVPLVERDARVKVSVSGAGFAISREGLALDGGGMGNQVRVKTDSGEIIRASVTGKNTLAVLF